MNSTLEASGLQHLLREQFGIQAHIVHSATPLTALGDFDTLFTDAITFVANMKSILPRQSHTIILTHETIDNDGSIAFISYKNLDELTAKLNKAFNKQDVKKATANSTLSQRELDVLRLVVSGCINKEIADRLGISINTVLTHRKNITAKLGIKSVSGLSFYAMMNGIVAPQ